jgi:hypothetical protein
MFRSEASRQRWMDTKYIYKKKGRNKKKESIKIFDNVKDFPEKKEKRSNWHNMR